MTRLTTYDPSRIALSVAGELVTGFASGRMLEYMLDDVVIQDDEGVDGEPVRWERKTPFSTLILYLSQSSPSNGLLSNLLNVDRVTMASIYPVTLEDRSTPSGRPTRLLAGSGWISSQPRLPYADGPQERRWDIRLLNVIHDVQGIGTQPAT